MADLISRVAAIAQIKENYCDWCDHTDLCPSCETRDCIATIEQQVPAVDAAPVVHAWWVKVSGYVTPGGDPVWKCSECGKGVHVYGIEHGTYGADIADGQWISCPNCGAKMDSERRDSE